MNELERIGFYTMSDARVKQASEQSPMWRCELILTNRCNFNCPYCRGASAMSRETPTDLPIETARHVLDHWIRDGLQNVRFSGGEPTLYPFLDECIRRCKKGGVKHIAISTNGSRTLDYYMDLVNQGVNDFSISLDACCASHGNQMAGISTGWDTIPDVIATLSSMTYVTVGVVLTENNVHRAYEIINFAHHLGVADIRIVSSAQWNHLIEGLSKLPQSLLDAHPILKYRVNNYLAGRNVRGIRSTDSRQCYLVQDDSIVAGQWHFPCVIHMREGGEPIGRIGPHMRQERLEWSKEHDTHCDHICHKNCLDVCIDYNNRCREFHNKRG